MIDPQPFVRAIMGLRAAAKAHKRSQRLHRQAAIDCMEEVARLEAICAEAGIKVKVNESVGEERHGKNT